MTKIEWADKSLNIVTGCTKVSSGCENCYAEKMSKRLKAMRQAAYHDVIGENGFWSGKVRFHGDRLNIPEKWRKPRMVFLNSMSDTFHEALDDTHIYKMLAMILYNPKHTFIVVTKRAYRAMRFINYLCSFREKIPIPNLWLLVSVEDQKTADERIPDLLNTNVVIRGLSMEPLIKYVDIFSAYTFFEPLVKPSQMSTLLDWIIVGGESGPGARPMNPNWVKHIRDQCVSSGVPFFFKQWGEWAPDCLCKTKKAHKTTERPGESLSIMFRCGKKKAGRLLDGREWNEYPDHRGKEDE